MIIDLTNNVIMNEYILFFNFWFLVGNQKFSDVVDPASSGN